MTKSKRKHRPANARSGRSFDLLYKLLSVIGFSAVLLPLGRIGTTMLGIPFQKGLFLFCALLAAGYFLGFLFAPKGQNRYDFTFEGTTDGENRLRPVIPCVIIAAAAFFLYAPITHYCQTLPNYVNASLLPLIALAFTAFLPMCGAVLAMIPFYKILSFRSIMAHIAIFAIFGLALPIYGYSDLPGLCISFLLWSFCAALVLNQTHLLKGVQQARTGKVQAYFRVYNFGMILLLLLFSLLFLAVLALTVNGLFLVLRAIGYFLLASFFNRPDSGSSVYVSPEEDLGSLGNGLFEGGMLDGASIYFFVALFILTLLLFIFGRRYHPLQKIGDLLRRFLSMLNHLFDGIFQKPLSRRRADETLPSDFTDVIRKQDPGAVFDRKLSAPGKGYRALQHQLDKCPNDSERLTLCYKTLLLAFQKADLGILPSDTPREVLAKLQKRLSFEEAEEITGLFEQIRYAEQQPSSGNLPSLIKKMCEMIKKYEKYD